MSTFPHVEQEQSRPVRAEDRLPLGQSAAVIAALSAVCWAAFIVIAMALRALT